MKFVQAIWPFISNAWLVAAPLVIVIVIIGVFAFIGIVQAIIERVFGNETAENFVANTMVLLWMALELALLGLVLYGLFCLARWFLRKKAP
jgi:hypothetical protein